MDISGISGSLLDSLNAFNLKDLLRGKNGKGLTDSLSLEALMPDAGLAVQSIPITNPIQNKIEANAGQSDLMTGNFAEAPGGQSRYLQAAVQSFKIEQQMVMASQQVLMAAAAPMLAAAGINAAQAASPAGAAMEMRRISNTKTLEASERNLKESREEIEAQAEEAMAPKDADGNPIPDITDTDAGPAPVAEPAPATAPEDTDAGGVTAADIETVAASEVAPPEIASAPAALPAKVSIDIRV